MTEESAENLEWDTVGLVRCEPARSGYRVVLVGEVDLTLAGEWQKALAILAEAQPRDVTVDLSAATFIDSSALGSLIRLHREIAARGGRTVLTGASGAVARTLQLSGLDSVIPTMTHG